MLIIVVERNLSPQQASTACYRGSFTFLRVNYNCHCRRWKSVAIPLPISHPFIIQDNSDRQKVALRISRPNNSSATKQKTSHIPSESHAPLHTGTLIGRWGGRGRGVVSYFLRQKINIVAPSRNSVAGGGEEIPRRGNPERNRK
jgi:hypothetical protein